MQINAHLLDYLEATSKTKILDPNLWAAVCEEILVGEIHILFGCFLLEI